MVMWHIAFIALAVVPDDDDHPTRNRKKEEDEGCGSHEPIVCPAVLVPWAVLRNWNMDVRALTVDIDEPIVCPVVLVPWACGLTCENFGRAATIRQ